MPQLTPTNLIAQKLSKVDEDGDGGTENDIDDERDCATGNLRSCHSCSIV